MRLISFITISFLAITVSAQAPQKYSYKSLRASQSPRQFSQAEILVEIARLKAEYAKEAIFSPMDTENKLKEQEYTYLRDQVRLTGIRSEEAGLDSYTKSKRKGEYQNARAKLEAFNVEYDQQRPNYEKARKKYNNAKAAVELLVENQERIRIHNSENEVQTGPSLDSFYNIGILKDQIDEILRELESVVAKWEKIKHSIVVPGDGLTDQRVELRGGIRFYETQRDIAKKILQDYERSQSMGARFMKSLYSHLPNTQI
ncbi:hypothetical protein BASA50_003955 [Batrachochytrium salamandrivorans]|uniref:Uncharacterized protein n=1 Tax=Batrachochytrium salamandrivorans TaxID=1357716 RepID=A0ABQ8FJV8_9FUNG|nr:hypothetical protein BASA62_005914 [Batrachochytrium salamandrivorans]KAH6580404.1 hypothetical protein BASA60_002878 [Batrachochytrium salamandrivorans]KAH6593608.1 hypothetical protein BASA61_004226 [Batrachochytrium salamandrivorans]KAH6598072.1 hypothetical protein BASA50_003955 [Batrachochytrium salamandrivorans]KAH9272489.1 hypothetical protein BASA83_005298 [Batrachochytrium salamandrivorans]